MDEIESTLDYVAVGGGKTITFVGGICLLINNLTGAGMVLFASLYQQAGWLTVSFALFLLTILSTICGTMFIESMAMIPGNNLFQKRIEFTSCCSYYMPRRWYIFAQIFFQCSLFCNIVSSVVQSVQVMDFALAAIFGRTCAAPEFYPNFFHFHCPDPIDGHSTPFGENFYCLSIGFIITALLCIPLGLFNLDDNIIVQKFSTLAVFAITLIWISICSHEGLESNRVPAFGDTYGNVLGVSIFNFAIITSLPSWVNEKQTDVPIMRSLLTAMVLALVIFFSMGFFGGMAFDPWYNTDQSDTTLLDRIYDVGGGLARFTFYAFPVVVNLTSIPIFSIMQKYNLLENRVFSPRVATFVSVVLPWLSCIPFYTGNGFSNVVSWAGLIFNSVINFLIPPILYIIAIQRFESQSSSSSDNQSDSGPDSDYDSIKGRRPTRTNSGRKITDYTVLNNLDNDIISDNQTNKKTYAQENMNIASDSPSPVDDDFSRSVDVIRYNDPSHIGNSSINSSYLNASWRMCPTVLIPYRVRVSYCLVIGMSLLCLTTLGTQIYETATN